jgi:8-oxo-dGTP pyrophosphatase MutT (NUDIX family)
MSKNKAVSAGVVITDGDSLLLAHVTNGHNWDIPKGRMDEGETAIESAIRELREETGLETDASNLTTLGLYNYKPKKDLHLFLWRVGSMPDPTQLVCTSYFSGPKGRQPELDAFAVVSWDNIEKYCAPALVKVLRILEKRARGVGNE